MGTLSKKHPGKVRQVIIQTESHSEQVERLMSAKINELLATWTRRRFLGTIAGGTGVTIGPVFFPYLSGAPLDNPATSPVEDRAVVIIQLTGGNDILNTVIPFMDPAYHRARPTLRSVAEQAKPINDYLAFHPAFAPCEELFQEGVFAIIQGVGYPNSSRDHQQALRDWQTAIPGNSMERTGWIGRVCDHLPPESFALAPAVFVGTMQLPLALVGGRTIVPTIRRTEDLTHGASVLGPLSGSPESYPASLEDKRNTAEGELLEFLRGTAAQVDRATAKLAKVLERQDKSPRTFRYELQRRLDVIAAIVQARVGIRFFYTDLGGPEPGGFDTHANQAENHAALLAELASGLVHFYRRIEANGLSHAVLAMTFSEFGRTLQENGRRGTDHGAASSVFLLGGSIKGGLIGEHPSLTDLDQGGLRYHTDFRSLYRTVLEDWLGIPASPTLGTEPFAKVPILKSEAVLRPRA